MRWTFVPRHDGKLPGAVRIAALVVVLTGLWLLLVAGQAPYAGASGSRLKARSVDEGCDPVPGQVIVGYESGTSDQGQRATLKEEGAKRVDDLEAIDEAEDTREMDLVKVKGGLEGAISRLEGNAEVKFAEANCRVALEKTPNDPAYATQLWGLNNTGQTVNGVTGTPDADIDAPEGWDLSIGSNQVVVAIVDSGVDYNHEDLKDNIWTNLGEIPGNGKDDDKNGFVDDIRGWDFANKDNDPADVHSHGTHVAGTIGAVGNNGVGVTGISWAVRLMPVKVMGDDGRGSTANVTAGFAYAVSNGAKVLNASLGGPGNSQARQEVINGARDKTLFVVAAGNESQDLDQKPSYPCNNKAENLICVGATDPNDKLAFFSNYGPNSVDIAAPGVNILSTIPGNKYGFKNGTSMATPHVAGVAALVNAFQQGAKPTEVRGAILGALFDDVPALDGLIDKRRRLGLPKQPIPEKKLPTPKKPEPGEPTIQPNPPVDRPDLPDPTAPDAPLPNLDLYLPIGGGSNIVIIIGPYTQLPSLGEIGGTIGNVNRSYVDRVIASLKYERGGRCWYMTDDPSVPWVEWSCSDELYFPLNTDPSTGTFNLTLTPAQRAGLCAGKNTLTTRVLTKAGQSIEVSKQPVAIEKGSSEKRCGGKRMKKLRRRR